MDRAREALLRAQFKSKGKWYLAQQVDAFLEELSVLVEEDARDGEALSEAMRTLGKENQQLRAQLEEAQSAKSRQGEEESRRRVCSWKRSGLSCVGPGCPTWPPMSGYETASMCCGTTPWTG